MAGTGFFQRVRTALYSRRGRNVMLFCVFFIVATALWFVIALNDDGQADLRLQLELTHKPDSVVMLSKLPPSLTVSVTGRGSQLLKYNIGRVPGFPIDFRMYRDGNVLRLSSADLKTIARRVMPGVTVLLVSPDSLNLAFTSQAPLRLPVNLDSDVSPGPKAALSGRPVVDPDTVMVYFSGNRAPRVRVVSTEPLRIDGINASETRKVKVVAPPGTRAVPDSVDVTINVEPLILKTRKVKLLTTNVPHGERLITFPTQVDVMYMIPVSEYLDVEPNIKVVADYREISPNSGKVKLRVAEAASDLQNVTLGVDSVEYIIEKGDF